VSVDTKPELLFSVHAVLRCQERGVRCQDVLEAMRLGRPWKHERNGKARLLYQHGGLAVVVQCQGDGVLLVLSAWREERGPVKPVA
jgi:hypothetical protein